MSQVPTRQEQAPSVSTGVAAAPGAARRPLARRLQDARSSIVPYLYYGAQKLGRTGIVGVTLCMFSLVVFMTSNVPLHQQLQQDTARLEQARAAAAAQRTDRSGPQPEVQALSFVTRLPSRSDVPAIMATITAVAAASGIELSRGSYEFTAKESESIARYDISLPVSGSYPRIREFVENVLAAVPAIALDSMRIERGTVAESTIAADLNFTLLLGAES